MNNSSISFETMDLGSVNPTSVPMELIEVGVSVNGLVGDYAKAFVNEAYRVNPGRANQVQLSEEEVLAYCDYLLTKRVEIINNECKDFRQLKSLYIPSFIQYVLSMIGKVVIRDYGLTIMPVVEEKSKMTLKQAYVISEKIGSFENDLQIVQDAMPRDINGNSDVMSTALIAGYVRSLKRVGHPAATYVTAFLNMSLRKETAFQTLYRIQYDDLEFISMALTTQKGLY